jgi:hypothetical protein
MMSGTIKIVSDGTARGTKITLADGTLVSGVCEVRISIKGGPDEVVKAELTFEAVELEIAAEEVKPKRQRPRRFRRGR